ncbi:MAG: bifunctional UDP-N-acetylmuramoyl-tripeptide:D-alanyl-D-alanine ligase/alanine racemase [Chitinophagales bacterium]|nr:bifunctional UDP-N-acetylmuramoyl-tripeptide:D-alanyl-D-alanine ligase/alanine racemase [Chitinophagales bacterium]MDW8428048.1 bifunctional UDP-N-acetylmuramoyl-tripeptide:D-alanyl-D-alanine ligase/alanine racemase [Chitinophagales bacterium]
MRSSPMLEAPRPFPKAQAGHGRARSIFAGRPAAAMRAYSMEQIARVVRGRFLQQAETPPVQYLVTDSRRPGFHERSLFFAIRGARRDGHSYIREVYDKGVRNFIVSDAAAVLEADQVPFKDASVLLVKDTLNALQTLAAYHRQQFSIPVIGITGSNGKTIVKEWLFQLLSPDYVIVRSPKSYNSQIGVPLSVWQMDDFHNLAIFEAGISQTDEMANLARIIQPTIGLFTNIGEAHSEGFLNLRQKINEKLRLFIHAEVLIYCRDYLDITECIVGARNQLKKADSSYDGLRTFSWSRENADADVFVRRVDRQASTTTITLAQFDETFSFTIPFTDDASIENAIHCWMVLRWLGMDPHRAAERLAELQRVAMRLELKEAINQCSLINDSYNSDLNSLSIALDFLSQQKQHSRQTVILSDILQSGHNERELYASVQQLLNQHHVHRFIGIGPALMRQQAIFDQNGQMETSFYPSTEAFLEALQPDWFRHEAILLKGARPFAFERIARRLEQQIHETVLTIDLNALLHNLSVYQSLLAPQVKTMVMVKAFSYGSGSYEIAQALQMQHVDYLAVAYADEGVELRQKGISLPIMVMNPEPHSFEALLTYRLEPELYSLRVLRQFSQAAASRCSEEQPAFVHLELETGMNRLGIAVEDLDELLNFLTQATHLKVRSVFTHLAGSEDPSMDDYSFSQIHRFSLMSERIQRALGYPVIRHVVNSAGIIRFPEAHFDMVRLGIGLYGYDATGRLQQRLRPVGTLRTTISQIKKISEGQTVGYGRAAVARDDMTIATVAIGYADGLQRSLGNGVGSMLVRGRRCPIVGNICMDMTMIDVSAVPDCKEGDAVIVFGEDPTVAEVAAWSGTIPYEVLTGVSRRVKRVYVQE